MKKAFVFFVCLLLSIQVFSDSPKVQSILYGDDYRVQYLEIDSHQYILALGSSWNRGVSIIHSESCCCKSGKSTKENAQGPRLFSKKLRLQKYEEQQGICPHCTNHFEFAEMEGDHIIPYSKGGKTTYDNLQMLCKPCNRKKSNKYSY